MAYKDVQLPLPGFIALDWTLMTIALIPILIRLSLRARSRISHSTTTNVSDSFVVLSWLSGCVLTCINTWKNTERLRYISSPPTTLYYGVPTSQSGHLLYVSWVSLFFIYISLWSAKAAFLAFYYSMFDLQGRRTKITLLIACIFTSFTFVLHMGLIAFWCSPVSSNWSAMAGRPLCSAVHSISSVTISTFANIATDILIFSIPIYVLGKSARVFGRVERAGLLFVFMMGSISALAALVRYVCLKLIEQVPKASITHTIDVWALVEIVSSILAVCAPNCRTFARNWREQHGRHIRNFSGSHVAGATLTNETAYDTGNMDPDGCYTSTVRVLEFGNGKTVDFGPRFEKPAVVTK